MKKTIDRERFAYRGGDRSRAWCRLRVFEEEGWPRRAPVIIATEIASNPGPSVTNSVELIAALVWHFLERPASGLVFIEHYTAESSAGRTRGEEFAIVTFKGPGQFENPDWSHIHRTEVEAMLGCAAA